MYNNNCELKYENLYGKQQQFIEFTEVYTIANIIRNIFFI